MAKNNKPTIKIAADLDLMMAADERLQQISWLSIQKCLRYFNLGQS